MAIKLEDLKKVDFSQMLNTFYINNVILPLEKVEELKEKKDLNIRRLKEGLEEYNLLSERLTHIGNYGFNIVPYEFYPAWDADNNKWFDWVSLN